jgi:hypothetical protein
MGTLTRWFRRWFGRWYYVRKANIDSDLRDTFSRYGVVGMQVALGTHQTFVHKGQYCAASDKPYVDDLLFWLTEQHDRAARWEMWSLTMEIAVTIFVFIEVLSTFGVLPHLP